jgi:hypothetical protein
MPSVVYGSSVENGQLVPVLTTGQVFPSAAYVPYYQGKGVPTPTLPPPMFQQAGGIDNYSTGMMQSAAANDPFNMAKSPAIWAVLFLAVGILGLRHVHWRG